MKPASLALLLLILAGGAVGIVAYRNATEESRAWTALLALEGRDLRKQPAPETASHFGRFCTFPNGAQPWFVFRLPPGEPILLVGLQKNLEPGLDRVLVAAYGSDRRKLSEVGFPCGRSTFVQNAAPARGPQDLPLLRIDCAMEVVHEDIATARYYAVEHGRLLLVRLENAWGRLRPAGYTSRGNAIGPLPRPRPPEAWLAELGSPSAAPVLAALTYLGGRHLDSLAADDRVGADEPPAESAAVQAALAHPALRARILELRKSADPWIREAAEAVPLDGSP